MGKPNPISVWRAKKAFEDFTGHKATKSHSVELDSNSVAGYRLGSLVGVAYEATRDGETDQYFHRFKKSARPELVSRADGKQLYIAGGKYKVTDRGVEDMPQLFVVNPSRRRKRKSTRKRSAGGQFKRNPTRRKRKAPAMAVRRRRRRTARRSYRRNPIMIAAAPRRRRRRKTYSAARRRRTYRRNPSVRLGGRGGFRIGGMILPAMMVGAGAVGAEVAMGYLPLPAVLKSGPQRYLTKGIVSVLLGWGIAKFVNRKAGEAFAAGGIAIATHDALKASLSGFMPGLQFGGYNWDKYGYNMPSMDSYPNNPGIGYYSPGSTMPAMGEYMGEYMPSGGGFQA